VSERLDANEIALIRSWASPEGLRPHTDPDLRLEQLLNIREVLSRSLHGIESELRLLVNGRGTNGIRQG
jgi:hypothetical protein